MSCESLAIRIEPMDVYWQIEQQTKIQCVADVSSSLNNKYFLFSNANNQTKYYAWFNVGGAGVDPAVAGRTGVAVAIPTNASASAVASALAAALDALTGVTSEVNVNNSTEVYLTLTAVGESEVVKDGTAATGFTFVQCQKGRDLYLGAIDGEFSLSRETEFEDVTSHQTGVTPVTRLFKGTSATVELTLIETDTAKIKNLLDDGSFSSITPPSGTEVLGMGLSQIGQSVLPKAARLLLHPVSLPLTDTSRDYVFWKALPNLSEVTFSGETKQTITVEFTTFKDSSKPSEINLVAFHSDWKQYLPQD
jgi:hypothetical protein